MKNEFFFHHEGYILYRLYDPGKDHRLKRAHMVAEDEDRTLGVSNVIKAGDMNPAATSFNIGENFVRTFNPGAGVISSPFGNTPGFEYGLKE
jgi:hypothetical protein